jgi:hypothetical protein
VRTCWWGWEAGAAVTRTFFLLRPADVCSVQVLLPCQSSTYDLDRRDLLSLTLGFLIRVRIDLRSGLALLPRVEGRYGALAPGVITPWS